MAVPAQSILVVAKQMPSAEVVPQTATGDVNPDADLPAYVSLYQRTSYTHRFRCLTTQRDGMVTIPVYRR